MRTSSTFYILFITCFFLTKNIHCQYFKVLKKDKFSVDLEFTIDTSQIEKLIKNKQIVDFSESYYCLNQINKPIVPLFHFTFQLNDSTVNYRIENISSKKIKIKSIRKGEKAKKRGINSSVNNADKFDLLKICDPYNYRGFNGQNIQLAPIQFDSINNELICNYEIKIKVYFDKKINNTLSIFENTNKIKFTDSNFYSFKSENKKLKSLNPATSELLILYKDSNTNNANLLANWKNQKGIKTTLINIEKESTSIEIKNKISNLFSNFPNLKYVLLLGNHNEIPAFNYGYIDGDNYFSDSYYGQFTEDFYPELFIGRITGSSKEINLILKKSIFYEKENFEGDWMIKSIGLASNEGLGDGDNGEADWQHLRKIKDKLISFGYTKVYEFYDGDHGESDSSGSPDKTEIINALNEGVSLVNYTGHGDDNLFLTSQLSSTDLINLNNKNKNPFVVSVACDNGKFINNQGTLAETFLKCKDENSFTGSIGFCGSSILMDWAPPMLTQDEIVNTITTSNTDNTGFSLGELFYNSQIKMLNKYNTLGNGVMQTWILFGDPSLDLKSQIPQNLDFNYEYFKDKNELVVKSNTDNILLGISEQNKYLSSYLLKKGNTTIILDTNFKDVLLTFSKPNYKTVQYNLSETNSIKYLKNDYVTVYPNPISSLNTEIRITGIENYNSITLEDILGKNQQIHIKNEVDQVLVELNNLTSGIYFLNIKNIENQTITKRIIVN